MFVSTLTIASSETPRPATKTLKQIKAGVKARNGKMVGAGLEACARGLGRKS